MEPVKNQVEALLFASGRKMSVQELARLCKIKDEDGIKKALYELTEDYEKNRDVLKVSQDTDGWKLNVREKYIPLVRQIVADTELPKSVLETLAVIAWKYPAMQSEIIKIRTNKAYDHLELLEEEGFIERTKQGRTKKIKLTSKFFQYFELPHQNKEALGDLIPQELKDKLKKMETEIANNESVSKSQKENLPEIKTEDTGNLVIIDEPEVDIMTKDGDEKLETYNEKKSEENQSILDLNQTLENTEIKESKNSKKESN